MVKTINIILLSLVMIYLLSDISTCSTPYDIFKIKNGVLTKNEIWEGKIIITGDILIPKEITVYVKPNTWLIFNDFDINNLGKYPNKPEIIIEGIINIQKKSVDSITIYDINDKEILDILNRINMTKSIKIQQDEVDLESLKNTWKSFSDKQYVLLWTIIYAVTKIF